MQEYLDSPRKCKHISTLTQVIKHRSHIHWLEPHSAGCCSCFLTVLLVSYSVSGEAFSRPRHPRTRHHEPASCLSWTLYEPLLCSSSVHLLFPYQVECVVTGVLQKNNMTTGTLALCFMILQNAVKFIYKITWIKTWCIFIHLLQPLNDPTVNAGNTGQKFSLVFEDNDVIKSDNRHLKPHSKSQ